MCGFRQIRCFYRSASIHYAIAPIPKPLVMKVKKRTVFTVGHASFACPLAYWDMKAGANVVERPTAIKDVWIERQYPRVCPSNILHKACEFLSPPLLNRLYPMLIAGFSRVTGKKSVMPVSMTPTLSG